MHYRKDVAKFLNFADTALTNGQNHPVISSALAEFQYDKEKMSEGVALYDTAREKFQTAKRSKDTRNETTAMLKDSLDALRIKFQRERRIVRFVFKNNESTQEQLLIKQQVPQTYDKFVTTTERFYSTLLENEELRSQVEQMNLDKDDIEEGISLVKQIKQLKLDQLLTKGISENATVQKNKALIVLDNWIVEFFTVAKIALASQPQYLEALGKTVKS